MLKELRIRNLALVERLDWALGEGFTAITGETGAGKSVILGALNLVLGERADRTAIRSGSEQCSVEAIFQFRESCGMDARLEALGIEPCEGGELIVKRVITSSGTNRQFVNCSATTLAGLKEIGDGLVDLHGPHDHQSLYSRDRQLAVLDAFAENADILARYHQKWREIGTLVTEKQELGGDPAAAAREIELLEHQVAEIGAAALTDADGASLDTRYRQASNARRLVELCSHLAACLLGDEGGISDLLAGCGRSLREVERLDPAAAKLTERHAAAVAEVAELAAAIESYAAHLETDPARLAEIEQRVQSVESLKRKYGGSIESVLAHGVTASERLQRLAGRADLLAGIENRLAAANQQLAELGTGLRSRRILASQALAGAVRTHLEDLGFASAGFEVELTELAGPGASGSDSVNFIFAPNPGEPAAPLRVIASSGEISRVLLALKTALAERDAIPVLVFDEIDANVGGEIAHVVGQKMRALAESHQVLCITHLPQVAAKAVHHFRVSKQVGDGRTVSSILLLDGEARVSEIARMLGGNSPTASRLAESLLGG